MKANSKPIVVLAVLLLGLYSDHSFELTIFRSQPAPQTQLAEPTGPRSQPAPHTLLAEPGPSSQPAPQNQLEEPGPSSQPAFHTQHAETAAVGYGVVESGHLLFI